MPQKHEMALKRMSKKWSKRLNESNSSSSAVPIRDEEVDIVQITTNALVDSIQKVMAKVNSESQVLVEMRNLPQNHLPLLFQDNVIFGKFLEKQDERMQGSPLLNVIEKDALQKWLTIEDDSIIQDFLVEEELENLENNQSFLQNPDEIYSDDEVEEVPAQKKARVSSQSCLDRFEDLMYCCAHRNLTKTNEALKKAFTTFKIEERNQQKPATIQMTMRDCFKSLY